jgi:carbon-monoxide dehydrogenase medium subunit
VEELVRRHPSRILGTASLLTRLAVPRPAAGSGAAFAKYGTSRFDYTLVDVAACLRLVDGVCERARVAVGGIVPRCRRLTEAEAVLEGRELDAEAARAAGEKAAEVVTPIADPRASADYRRELLRVAVVRVVEEAGARASGGAA